MSGFSGFDKRRKIIVISVCKAQGNLQSYFSGTVISFHSVQKAEKSHDFCATTRSLLLIIAYCRTDMLVIALIGAFQLIQVLWLLFCFFPL